MQNAYRQRLALEFEPSGMAALVSSQLVTELSQVSMRRAARPDMGSTPKPVIRLEMESIRIRN